MRHRFEAPPQQLNEKLTLACAVRPVDVPFLLTPTETPVSPRSTRNAIRHSSGMRKTKKRNCDLDRFLSTLSSQVAGVYSNLKQEEEEQEHTTPQNSGVHFINEREIFSLRDTHSPTDSPSEASDQVIGRARVVERGGGKSKHGVGSGNSVRTKGTSSVRPGVPCLRTDESFTVFEGE